MTEAGSQELISVSVALMRTERELQDRLGDAMKRAGLLPPDCYLVLDEIVASPEGWLRQTSLQKCTRLAQYSVCRLVDRLERDGLVDRRTCPKDGRNNVILITAEGRALHGRMRVVYEQAVAEHFSGLISPAEARQLQMLLGKLQRE